MTARKKAMEELTKEMIVETANRHFLLNDFHKVSMRAIAQELGCSHGAIYYHFTNKNELFFAVVEKYFDELNKKLDASIIGVANVEQKMIDVFLGFIEFGLNHQSQYEFMFIMRNENTDPLNHQASKTSYMKFEETLQKLSEDKLNSFEIYATFMALHGFVSHYRGRVSNYLEACEDAKLFAQFLWKALEKK